MAQLDKVKGLIQGIQQEDPRLHEALRIMLEELDILVEDNRQVSERLDVISAQIPLLPDSFSYELKYRNISFTWSEVVNARNYELRKGNSGLTSSWDASDFITRVSNLGAEIAPTPAGLYHYLLKTMNAAGIYSTDFKILPVTIPEIPTLSITAQIIDNNVLLDWTEPSHPFEIVEYQIFKGENQIGYIDSSFFVYFEMVGGVYTYKVRAVDVAGNMSPFAEVTVNVSQPPDYILEDLLYSDLSGTSVNVFPITA